MGLKLSEFEMVKRLVFNNGEAEYIETELNGEILFSNLDSKRIQLINDKVIKKLKKTTSNEEIAYRLIPFITDIECDVTLTKFKEMMETPSNPMIALSNALFEYIQNIINMGDKLLELNKASNKFEKQLKNRGFNIDQEIETETVNDNVEEVTGNIGE